MNQLCLLILYSGESNKLLEIGRAESLEEITEKIIFLFHPHIQNLLRMCGFKLARADRSKRISPILNVTNGSDLERKIMQSKVIVMPLKDFPSDLPAVDDHDSPVPESSTTDSSPISPVSTNSAIPSISTNSTFLPLTSSAVTPSTFTHFTGPSYNTNRFAVTYREAESEEDDELEASLGNQLFSNFLVTFNLHYR